MVLTKVTGHKIHTIGKIRITILLRNRRIRHTIYMMKDDFPDFERILRIDFLQNSRQHATRSNFALATRLKLQPYAKSY